jgi:hypothetical protein
MKSNQETQSSTSIEVHYRVFSMSFVAYITMENQDSIPRAIDEFIESIRKTTSRTAYILFIKSDENIVYISSVKKRENQLWQQPRNQRQSA